MDSVIIVSNRPWNSELHKKLESNHSIKSILIDNKEQLNFEFIKSINPKWIFVPHWSFIIPKKIWHSWPTIIFHMTDLPEGKGGSPLQNLISKGYSDTKITAIKCSDKLDGGDIFLKENLPLFGTAEEIFIRANSTIEKMIFKIIKNCPVPYPQKGKGSTFHRRDISDSNLNKCLEGSKEDWFNTIRMLDAEGYPHAYIETNGMKLEFRRVTMRCDGLYADVKIFPKKNSKK